MNWLWSWPASPSEADNQWYLEGSTIPLGRHDYRPLADTLVETFQRYGRPLLITETGAEGSARAAWFHYVCDEVRDAIDRAVPVQGVCLYPVTNFPDWDDGRFRLFGQFGLFGAPDADGGREAYAPLAAELRRQQERLEHENGLRSRLAAAPSASRG
jgi:hypothetical protein